MLLGSIGLVGAVVLWKSWAGVDNAEQESAETVPVIVADRFLPAYSPLKNKGLVIRNFPAHFVPPGAFRSFSELAGENGQPRFASVAGLPEGQPLTRALVMDLSQNRGLSSILGPGRVAVSFAADRIQGVGGWIQPGDHIAIYKVFHHSDAALQAKRATELLFSAAEVVAVDHHRVGAVVPETKDDAAEGDMNIITVSMNPVQAGALLEARTQGSLTVALRALGDDAPIEVGHE
jgi:Flp pilus assembly protein CpaB